MSEKVWVLMSKTIQPRCGRILYQGEEYPLPVEIAERIISQGRGRKSQRNSELPRELVEEEADDSTE